MIKILFYLYNKSSSFLEKLIYQLDRQQKKNAIVKNGYKHIKLKKKIQIKLKNKKKIRVNKYMNKYVLTKNEIEEIIFFLFLKNGLKKYLENSLSFKFNINYIIAYQTLTIKKNEVKKGWYANHWHKDKAFSKNILKLIIPLENINKEGGGIQIYNKEISRSNIINLKAKKPFIFSGNRKDIVIFNPNQCYHKAGNPKSKSRSQIMIQLNPSREWNFDKKLFEKQLISEPKFPFFSNLIRQNKKISWKS